MFRPQNDFTYLMPAHFGGGKFDPETIVTQRSTSLVLSYETDRKGLENYIPEGFELLAPEVQVSFSKFTEINWMQGGQYNLINVAAPVRFHGKKDRLDGAYTLVVWENKTAPILGGREQTGIPKIHADIEDLHIVRPHYATTISYEGNTFLTMDFEAAGPIAGEELDVLKSQFASVNTLGWRYIPKVGAPGAELSQFVLYPQGVEVESAQAGTGSLRWTELTPMQNPAQYYIINSLAALPVKRVTQAVLTEGRAVLHAMGARVIE
ncbi:acetoacetate decarboxylase [Methanofollis aquaemaris]|uniref:Acetoacetate decarboxylase n=1 Tax=Methanofollis aquaemaris TaxID=126734 RepID=A0A8A3S3B8_9EURY|nr:acetoacetate decarboxylase family protein [Methanofollis aquaemaris]QSZ66136.1 acetoacetate decarboxylase [Methanofollis aquaemaris]